MYVTRREKVPWEAALFLIFFEWKLTPAPVSRGVCVTARISALNINRIMGTRGEERGGKGEENEERRKGRRGEEGESDNTNVTVRTSEAGTTLAHPIVAIITISTTCDRCCSSKIRIIKTKQRRAKSKKGLTIQEGIGRERRHTTSPTVQHAVRTTLKFFVA